MDVVYVQAQKLLTHPLSHAIPIYNIDGTPYEAGLIKEEVDYICIFENHIENATFLITCLRSMEIILRYIQLVKYNPEINWQIGKVKMSYCPNIYGNRAMASQSLDEAMSKPRTHPACRNNTQLISVPWQQTNRRYQLNRLVNRLRKEMDVNQQRDSCFLKSLSKKR